MHNANKINTYNNLRTDKSILSLSFVFLNRAVWYLSYEKIGFIFAFNQLNKKLICLQTKTIG